MDKGRPDWTLVNSYNWIPDLLNFLPMNLPADYHSISLSYVIPMYFDQQNTDTLNDLLRMYADYEPQLLDRLQFVLVDDCSPVPVSIPTDINLNLLLLRIKEDIKWNQGGARNLGVVYSRSDKVLATDIDHYFSRETLKHVMGMPRLGKKIYRMRRKNIDGDYTKPHPNTFLMSRGRFIELYGVDEEFSGFYGCEDGMFWRWQRYNGTRFRYLDNKYASLLRKVDRHKSYHTLERDTRHNTELKNRKKEEWRQLGPWGGHSRQFLKFTWDIVEDRKREGKTWQPPENLLWKKLWFVRQFYC